jgi:hypothetical protein
MARGFLQIFHITPALQGLQGSLRIMRSCPGHSRLRIRAKENKKEN